MFLDSHPYEESLWRTGFAQFEYGNYYAAKDIWVQVEKSAHTPLERCQALNAIGACVWYLSGDAAALKYFQIAYDVSRGTNLPVELKMKITGNIGITLGFLGEPTRAIDFCRQALEMDDNCSFPLMTIRIINAVASCYQRLGASSEIIRLVPKYKLAVGKLQNKQWMKGEREPFYQYIGMAATRLDDFETAIEFYNRAHETAPESDACVFMARLLLELGRGEDAIPYLSQVVQNLSISGQMWEPRSVAHSLELIGTFLHVLGEVNLGRRCLEKAELYFGQMQNWDEWAAVRKARGKAPNFELPFGAFSICFRPVNTFLDDRVLLDTVESELPKMDVWSKTAVAIAEQIVTLTQVSLTKNERKTLQMAGRFYYLGLATEMSSEDEAIRILKNKHGSVGVSDVTRRLLEIYSHARPYLNLLTQMAQGPVQENPDVTSVMADSLRFAFDYVEQIELYNLTSAEALKRITDESRNRYSSLVLDAVHNLFALGTHGTVSS